MDFSAPVYLERNPAQPIAVASRSGPPECERLHQIIRRRLVTPVFQPIIDLASGELFGYEALTRLPEASGFPDPGRLFAAAKRHGVLTPLELVCAEKAVATFTRLCLDGKLLLNFSPQTVVAARLHQQESLQFLQKSRLQVDRIIIELTEQHHTPDLDALRQALMLFRSLGIDVAIDDLGQGFSSLWLWSELRPELVKVDMHFVQGIHKDPIKFHFLKAIQQIADIVGARLIAEGIEQQADLLVLRDLGIHYGQGYFIGRPVEDPKSGVDPRVLSALRSPGICVFPQLSRVPSVRPVTAEKLLMRVEPVHGGTTNEEVLNRFEASPAVNAIPVVDETRPMGLINRHTFTAQFVRPYMKELFGKRPCRSLLEGVPLVVDKGISIHELSDMLTDVDQRQWIEGFVITENGRYLGLGAAQDLIREINRLQFDAARYANPLTLLPGNVPIDGHIDRLLTTHTPFAAAYCDLNDFKPFNDAYGYRRGDDMIKLTAQVLTAACDPRLDFIGHIGGDDFILLFQSPDWSARCDHALKTFAREAQRLFDPADRERGSLMGEDRRGVRTLFPLTTLSIGIVLVDPHLYGSHLQVSAAASEAKKQAKRAGGNTVFIERRKPAVEPDHASDQRASPSKCAPHTAAIAATPGV